MEFEDALEDIAAKLADYGDSLTMEEATKNAIIMPFISQVLGYDVFNPKEVMPEFTADLGTKKGEKIDYAILHDGEVQMLIECKKNGDDLKLKNVSQLFRYFHASNARIGVLTNGRTWSSSPTWTSRTRWTSGRSSSSTCSTSTLTPSPS